MADGQIAESERVADERHAAYLREFDKIEASIQRVHDRLDTQEKRQSTFAVWQQETNAKVVAMEATIPRLERIADAVETMTSRKFWLKIATAIGVAATIGGQIIAFADKIH